MASGQGICPFVVKNQKFQSKFDEKVDEEFIFCESYDKKIFTEVF